MFTIISIISNHNLLFLVEKSFQQYLLEEISKKVKY